MAKGLKEKIDFLFELIKLNDSYYHGHVPDFEIKHLLKLGAEQEYINEQLIKYKLTIRNTNL